MEVGEEGDYIYIYISLSPPEYIKVGSDESHFNVSVGCDGQSQDSVHKPQPF